MAKLTEKQSLQLTRMSVGYRLEYYATYNWHRWTSILPPLKRGEDVDGRVAESLLRRGLIEAYHEELSGVVRRLYRLSAAGRAALAESEADNA